MPFSQPHPHNTTTRPYHRLLLLTISLCLTCPLITFSQTPNPFIDQTSMPSRPHQPTPLHTQRFTLHYVSPTRLKTLIDQAHDTWLTPDSHLTADDHSQQLWVHSTPLAIQRIQQLIQSIDTPTPQVMVKSRIINIDHQYINNMGITLQSNNTQNTNDTAHTSASSLDHMIIPLLNVNQLKLITLHVNSLLDHGHATLMAEPELFAMNHQTASIESGEEVPYQQSTSSGATSVAFKKAVMKLHITPTLLPHHHVLLNLHINQDTVSGLTVNGVPAIQTQQLTTTVLLHDQQTVILGGIYSTQDSHQTDSIPLLTHLPLIGVLFKHHNHSHNKKELLIFITPYITTASSPPITASEK